MREKLQENNDSKIRRLDEIPLLNLLGKRINNLIENFGIQGAALELVHSSHSKLEIEGYSPQLENVLKKEATLLISNHTYDIEPVVVVAACPCREDVTIISTHTLLGLSDNFARHILPVFHTENSNKNVNTKRFVKIPDFMKSGFCPQMDDFLKAKFNLQSIKTAAKRIIDQGLVYLAPEGSRGKEGKWSAGIGHLLKEIGANTNAYLVQSFVEGTSDFDMARIMPFVGKIMPTIKVYFREPLLIKDLFTQESQPKSIVQKLESDYNNWVKSLV